MYSEEITENQVKSLKAEAEKQQLTQSVPLGRADSPGLPAASVDLAYMRVVYHHVSKPREMLRGIWQARNRTAISSWWTVCPARCATGCPASSGRASISGWPKRRSGAKPARKDFGMSLCADELCESKDNPFVLIFQRPANSSEPGGDPDPFLPLAVSERF